jgi:CheY-like chemotaxis protein
MSAAWQAIHKAAWSSYPGRLFLPCRGCKTCNTVCARSGGGQVLTTKPLGGTHTERLHYAAFHAGYLAPMKRGLTILVVEDEAADAELLMTAMKRAGFTNPVRVVENGERAIAYLEGRAPYDDRTTSPVPSLIFTDLKMPMVSGFEVLQWIREHPSIKVAPIIVLTGSALPEDVAKAYRLGANSYITKPQGLDAWAAMIKLVADYWDMCEKPPLTNGKGISPKDGGKTEA